MDSEKKSGYEKMVPKQSGKELSIKPKETKRSTIDILATELFTAKKERRKLIIGMLWAELKNDASSFIDAYFSSLLEQKTPLENEGLTTHDLLLHYSRLLLWSYLDPDASPDIHKWNQERSFKLFFLNELNRLMVSIQRTGLKVFLEQNPVRALTDTDHVANRMREAAKNNLETSAEAVASTNYLWSQMESWLAGILVVGFIKPYGYKLQSSVGGPVATLEELISDSRLIFLQLVNEKGVLKWDPLRASFKNFLISKILESLKTKYLRHSQAKRAPATVSFEGGLAESQSKKAIPFEARLPDKRVQSPEALVFGGEAEQMREKVKQTVWTAFENGEFTVLDMFIVALRLNWGQEELKKILDRIFQEPNDSANTVLETRRFRELIYVRQRLDYAHRHASTMRTLSDAEIALLFRKTAQEIKEIKSKISELFAVMNLKPSEIASTNRKSIGKLLAHGKISPLETAITAFAFKTGKTTLQLLEEHYQLAKSFDQICRQQLPTEKLVYFRSLAQVVGCTHQNVAVRFQKISALLQKKMNKQEDSA